MKFWGYRRPDGKVGIRNHVLILPASVCASDTTRIIASQVSGAITFNKRLFAGAAGYEADDGYFSRLCGKSKYLWDSGSVLRLRGLPDGSGGGCHPSENE